MTEHMPRLVFPSIWVHHEPLLRKVVRVRYARFVPSVYVLWRWPWEHEGIGAKR